MLNRPCHIHSAFVYGKQVSRHAMKDCMMFLKSTWKVPKVTRNRQKVRKGWVFGLLSFRTSTFSVIFIYILLLSYSFVLLATAHWLVGVLGSRL
jgi:hypothetical protein